VYAFYDVKGLKADFSEFDCFFDVAGYFDGEVIIGVLESLRTSDAIV